jgi:hypothetical protein
VKNLFVWLRINSAKNLVVKLRIGSTKNLVFYLPATTRSFVALRMTTTGISF